MLSVQVNKNGTISLIPELRENLLCLKEDFKTYTSKHSLLIPEIKRFTQDDLYLKKIPSGNESYSKKINMFSDEGNPQMCLLLPEIYFLSRCIRDDKKTLVLYIGGHPGDHINFLASLFEEVNFIVYDADISMNEDEIMKKIGIDPYSNGEPLKNVELRKKFFSADEANEIKRITPENQDILLISDIRNKKYDIKQAPEINSKILDDDTYMQISWCEILKPRYALLKYRPKLEEECLTVPENLTDSSDSDEARKLYYKYPKGYFLALPMQKKTQKAMYFMCNKYDLEIKYCHRDMISMINYHHNYRRRAIFYDNPFENDYGMNKASLGINEVEEIAKKLGYEEDDFQYEEFCFGSNWDFRAAIFIIITYISYKKKINIANIDRGISNNFVESISEFLIFPYIYMKKGEIELKN